MSLTALLYLFVILSGAALSLARGPIWGMATYIFVYLVAPDPALNWWARDVPDLRWSLLLIFVLLVSFLLHKEKLSEISLGEIAAGKLLLGYLLLSLAVSLAAVDPAASFGRCYDFFRYVVVFYMVVKSVKTRGDLVLVLLTIVVSGFILGYTAYTIPRHGGRLENVGPPDAADSNNLGLLFASIIPLTLSLFQEKNKICKLLALAAFVFMANGLILCNSRGASLSLIVAMVVVVYLLRLPGVRKKIMLCILLMLCGFLYLTDVTFVERFNTISESAETDGGSGRLQIWASGLDMVKDYPLGAGGLGFQRLSPQYVPEKWLTRSGVRSSHNTMLLILTEQGIMGFGIAALFIARIFLCLKSSYRIVSSRLPAPDVNHQDVTAAYVMVVTLAASIVCVLVGSLFGDRLYYELIYIQAAMAVALVHRVNSWLSAKVLTGTV